MTDEERLAGRLLVSVRVFLESNDMTQTYPELDPEDSDGPEVSRREVTWAKTLGLSH